MDKLAISYEEMRSLVIEALPMGSQVNDLYRAVASVAARRYGSPETAQNQNTIGPRYVDTERLMGGDQLDRGDKARVWSIFWDLLIEGVVRPGLQDAMNENLPFYHITEFGRNAIKDGGKSPYDPDGYL